MNSVYPTFVFLSFISTFLPFLAGSKLYKKIPSFRILWLFFAFSATTDLTLFILNSLHQQTAWIASIYTVCEYIFISIILAEWHHNKLASKMMLASIPAFLLTFAILKYIKLENLEAYSINRPLALLLLSAFASMTLLSLWKRQTDMLPLDFRFWMLIAILLYYCGSLIPFAFMSVNDGPILDWLFQIHALINILHNLLFCAGIYIAYKYEVPPTRSEPSV